MGRIRRKIQQSKASGQNSNIPFFRHDGQNFPKGKRVYFMFDLDDDDDFHEFTVHQNPKQGARPYTFPCTGDPDTCEYCEQGAAQREKFAFMLLDLETDEIRVWETSSSVLQLIMDTEEDHDIDDSVFRVKLNRDGNRYQIQYVGAAGVGEDDEDGILTEEQWELVDTETTVGSLYGEN